MRSMTARMTVGYALAVTVAVAVALAAGRWLLQREMIDGLNLLHEAEFNEVVRDLKLDVARPADEDLARQMRAHSEADEHLFFFQVHDAAGRLLFRSANLGGTVLPDLSAFERRWTMALPPHGRVHASEFRAGDLHIQIGSRLEPTERLLRQYTQISLGLTVIVAAGSLGLGYGLSRVILRPLRDIRHAADRIGADNLGERIPPPPGRDEVAELVRLLNATFDRLEAAFQQVRQFSADASHELRTPLTLIRLNAERLRTRLPAEGEAAAIVDTLLEEIARMNRLIENLLFLAKAESGVLPVSRLEQDTTALIREVAEDAAVLAEDRGQRLVVERNDAGSWRFDRHLIRQLLLNLVSNAVAVMKAGGTLTLRSTRAEAGWRIEVLDEGPGLPADQLERIFERFVHLPHPDGAPSGGHGLGLAICRGIVRLHGGEIRAWNRPDRSGLCLVVELPGGGATADGRRGGEEERLRSAVTPGPNVSASR
ncbi:MAG: HAMP domain-containing protein [Opitutaceae bacterium]|nr:HAMP domain-containing protein [Opitutaceae bacterium]